MRRLLLVSWVAAIGACHAPLLQDDGGEGPHVRAMLPDAHDVEVVTDDGIVLRGVFVEASPDAPVVLHLLSSSVSVAHGISNGLWRHPLAPTLRSFTEAGWSSLVIDYRGIGESDGRRDGRRLASDGLAMWREAVRRADSPDQVVIRAASLGSLLTVDLLARGSRPRGVVLIAPIRAETVVAHGAKRKAGGLLGGLAAPFYRRPLGSGLCEMLWSIEVTEIPMLVILPSEDPHVSDEEIAMIANAASAGGHTVVHRPDDHAVVVLRSWGFTVERDAFRGVSSPALLAEESAFLAGLRDR